MEKKIIKLAFNKTIRKIEAPPLFKSLVEKTRTMFGADLPVTFHYYYRDEEGDLIQVSSQEDYDIALPVINKFYIAESAENIKDSVISSSFSSIAKSQAPAVKRKSAISSENNPRSATEESKIPPSFSPMSDISKKDSSSIICSFCKKRLGNTEENFECLTCPNYFLCSKCKDTQTHSHPLLKHEEGGEVPSISSIYSIEYLDKNKNTKFLAKTEEALEVFWEIHNHGTKTLPLSSIFADTGGDVISVKPASVGALQPGERRLIKTIVKASKQGIFKTQFHVLHHGIKKIGPSTTLWLEVSNGPNVPKNKVIPSHIEESHLVRQKPISAPCPSGSVPAIQSLKDMFPYIDITVLQDALYNCNNDIQQTAEFLFNNNH